MSGASPATDRPAAYNQVMTYNENERVDPLGSTGGAGWNPAQHPRASDGQWEKKLGAPATVQLDGRTDRFAVTADAIQNSWGSFAGYDVEPGPGGSYLFRFVEDNGNIHWEANVDTNGLLTDVYHNGKRINSHVSLYEDAEYELADAHDRPLSQDDIVARRELNDAIAYQRSVGADIDTEIEGFHGATDYAAIDAHRVERVKAIAEEYRSTLTHPFKGLAESRKQDQLDLVNLAARRRTAELRASGVPAPRSALRDNNPFKDCVNDVELEDRIRTYDGPATDALAYATERKRELAA